MIHKLLTMIEDNAGGISTMRVICITWTAAVGAIWVLIALSTQTLPDIPTGVLMLTGWLISGKVVQRFGER